GPLGRGGDALPRGRANAAGEAARLPVALFVVELPLLRSAAFKCRARRMVNFSWQTCHISECLSGKSHRVLPDRTYFRVPFGYSTHQHDSRMGRPALSRWPP